MTSDGTGVHTFRGARGGGERKRRGASKSKQRRLLLLLAFDGPDIHLLLVLQIHISPVLLVALSRRRVYEPQRTDGKGVHQLAHALARHETAR